MAAAVIATVLLLAAVLVTLLVVRSQQRAATEQARAVTCVSAAQRAQLVNAAAVLGSGAAVPGRPEVIRVRDGRIVALLDWRRDERTRTDFDQACALLSRSLRAAAPGGGSTSPTLTFGIGVLTALLPVALGSWLTRRTTSARDRETLRRKQVDDLHQAVLEYQQVAGAYLRQRSGNAASDRDLLDTVEERRLRVAALLGQVTATHRHWDAPRVLRGRLTTELGGDFVGQSGQISGRTAAELRAKVDALLTEIDDVATTLDAGTEPRPPSGKKQVTAGGTD